MPPTIAIANQKGGVAKTTTAAALGAILTDRGQRVLWVDLDPQASLTTALGVVPANDVTALMKVRIDTGDVPDVHSYCWPIRDASYLLRSHLDLAALEAVDLMKAFRREYVLADLLSNVAAQYDVILIDCPPSLGLLTVNALTAATDVLIPCSPEYLAAQGLGRLLDTIRQIRKGLNRDLRIAGVVPTLVQYVGRNMVLHHQALHREIQAAAQAAPLGPIPLFAPIPRQIAAADAAGQGRPVPWYQPDSPISAAYAELADRLFPVRTPTHA